MIIQVTLNGEKIRRDIEPDMTLFDFVRSENCLSVKCGCETSSCGLCTVFVDDRPVLSCSMLAARADGRRVDTLEGLQEEAEDFAGYIADRGADQCGFCNPGLVMNTIALLRENPDPTRDEVREYLSGNLCRCSGYEGQTEAVMRYLADRKERASHV
jgi:carbon-monoxide dehydrogenase small subunit